MVLAHRPHDVIEEIELSPDYEYDNTLFIIVRGNVYKSTNGGEYWTRIVTGLDNNYGVSSVSISPIDKNVVYVSTEGDGIYKSIDGGLTWNNSKGSLEKVSRIVAINSGELWAAGMDSGLFKSIDGGIEWDAVQNKKIAAFDVSGNIIAAADNEGQLHFSYDYGATWTTLNTNSNITVLAISPKFSSDKMILAGTTSGMLKITNSQIDEFLSGKHVLDIVFPPNYEQNNLIFASTWNQGCFVSKDDGNTWINSSNGLTKDRQADEMNSPHFSDLEIAETGNLTLYLAGFDGLFKSENGGMNWRQIETLSEGTILEMAVSPNYENDSTVAMVNYVGEAYISYDGGGSWSVMRNGLESAHFLSFLNPQGQDDRRFYDIVFSPDYANDQTIFASVLWERVVKSTDKGKNWKIIPLPGTERGPTIAMSPSYSRDSTIFIGAQYGNIYKSENNGESFVKISSLGGGRENDPLALIVSPYYENDRTLFATGPLGVYRSTNAGVEWEAVSLGTELGNASDIKLAISPEYELDQTVIAGTNQGLFMTKDRGDTWHKIEILRESDSIEAVAFSPNYENDNLLLISVKGKGLFKTEDQGLTFEHIGNDSIQLSKICGIVSSPTPILFSPAYAKDNTIFGFGSAETEIFKSTNGGYDWEIIKIPREKIDEVGLLGKMKLKLFEWRVKSVIFYKRNGSLMNITFGMAGLFILFLIAILLMLRHRKK
jgi:photosystem II stability/assembly factor-like uncharacterized protein